MTALVIAILHSNPQHLNHLHKHRFLLSHFHAGAGVPVEPHGQLREIVRVGFICFLLGTHALALTTIQGILKLHQCRAILGISLGVPLSFFLIFLVVPGRWERAADLTPSNLMLASGSTLVYMALNVHVSVPNVSLIPTSHAVYLALAFVIFGSAAYIAAVTFSSELKEIKDFPRALATVQISEMVLYAVMVIVVYSCVRPEITVPGFDPAAMVLRRLCDGIAIPTVCMLPLTQLNVEADPSELVVGGVVDTYAAANFLHRQMPRVSRLMQMPPSQTRVTWTAASTTIFLWPGIAAKGVVFLGDLLNITVREGWGFLWVPCH